MGRWSAASAADRIRFDRADRACPDFYVVGFVAAAGAGVLLSELLELDVLVELSDELLALVDDEDGEEPEALLPPSVLPLRA